MAENVRPLVLCTPLCFMFSKLGKLEIRKITSLMCDFYSAEEISTAKKRLAEDIMELHADKMPRLAPRRDNDVRARIAKDVDDIANAVITLDERGFLQQVPRYVTDNSDTMPTIRLEEGDLRYFCKKMENMETILSCLMHSVNNLQELAHTTDTAVKGVNKPPFMRSSLAKPTVNVQADQPKPAHHVTNTIRNTTAADGANRAWATDGQFSSFVSHDERNTDNEGFTEVVNSRKRLRMFSAQQDVIAAVASAAAAADHESTAATGNEQGFNYRQKSKPKQLKKPLIIGKKSSEVGDMADPTATVVAAKPWVTKAVFCVDNVDVSMTPESLTQFVTSLSIRVVSCFKVNPRLTAHERRSGIEPTDHKTFRLCIYRDDVDALLVADKWPDGIVISNCFFSGKPAPATDATKSETSAKFY